MTNADLEKLVETSDEWIVTRTGIRERRIADREFATSDMAVEAIKRALDMANTSPDEIELLLVGTVTPDYRLPSTACVVQEKMSLPNAAAIDVVAACSGFLTNLSMARGYIETGMYRKILVVGSEKLSSITNYHDRNTCVLFGDGAGAAVVAADDSGSGVLSTFIRSDGRMRDLLWVEAGGTALPMTADMHDNGADKIQMNGAEVFKVAVREMSRAAKAVLDDAGLQPSDISLVIPHQANIRIIEALAKRLHVGMDKFVLNIEKYGNTSAASVPLALDEANRAGRVKSGDIVLMVAFGGGLVWSAALIRW